MSQPPTPPEESARRRGLRQSPNDFADVAFGRASRAITAYTELGDRWDTTAPSPIEAADVAVDAAIALEASLKAVADHLNLGRGYNRVRELFDVVARQPSAPADLRAVGPSVGVVFDARNEYLHAALPAAPPHDVLAATRDVIRAVLKLAGAYPLLASRWQDVANALWTFDGQPAHFATQARTHFAHQSFTHVRCRCNVARFTGGSRFALTGALRSTSEVGQGRYDFTGGIGPWFESAPDVQVAVGTVEPPESGALRTASGETEQTGTLTLAIRDLPVVTGGISHADNALAAPLYLVPDSTSAWMPSPGSLQLRMLRLSIPYRVASRWFVTPDGRQEIWSEFLDCDATGSVEGALAFHYPGHAGSPAFRGLAAIHGTVGPCRLGWQLAEWAATGFDATTNALTSWMWNGITQLRFWCDLDLTVTFGDVEVFDSP